MNKRRRRRPHQHPGVVPPTTTAPERSVDRRLQRPVPHRRSDLLLSADDRRSAHPLSCWRATGLLSTRGVGVRPVFERVFREYGLPRAIRTDNGVPFATTALTASRSSTCGGCARHSAPAHPPAHPQQNGAHERMHKTLKRGAIRPPRATLAAPAAGLQSLSAGVQRRAARTIPARPDARRPLPPVAPAVSRRACPRSSIPGHFMVKRITNAGTIRFKTRLLYLVDGLATNTTSGWRKSTTASGPSTSAPSCSDARRTEGLIRGQPVLPMLPVNSVTYLPGCSCRFPSECESC